ncbi:hypothetical protein RRG08_047321 [Elysia crispata]|uniref:Uncharacterized protein n=1 Tax=Elysia crispata TaxID=231223 RepID=A0AAE1B2C2_9GAST|nr:hypothetical protein RRG08_047321 [Elysia crispata]
MWRYSVLALRIKRYIELRPSLEAIPRIQSHRPYLWRVRKPSVPNEIGKNYLGDRKYTLKKHRRDKGQIKDGGARHCDVSYTPAQTKANLAQSGCTVCPSDFLTPSQREALDPDHRIGRRTDSHSVYLKPPPDYEHIIVMNGSKLSHSPKRPNKATVQLGARPAEH